MGAKNIVIHKSLKWRDKDNIVITENQQFEKSSMSVLFSNTGNVRVWIYSGRYLEPGQDYMVVGTILPFSGLDGKMHLLKIEREISTNIIWTPFDIAAFEATQEGSENPIPVKTELRILLSDIVAPN